MEPTNSKEKILSAAAKLFRKKGYHATSLSQITKESSAPRGSIYYYFPDGKQQLAKEAIQKTGERVKAEQELQLYNQISKKKDEAIERERRASRQFVYRLRGPGSPLQ